MRHRGFPGLNIVALAVASALVAVLTHAGDGEGYIDAYNELVRMTAARCKAVGVATNDLSLKNIAVPSKASVTIHDLNALRDKVKEISHKFVTPEPDPGPWSVDDAYALKAFPTLYEVYGPGFLIIPAECTENAQPVYSHTFSGNWNDVPVLWEQLLAVHRRLVEMRCTLISSGTWSSGPDGPEPNERFGSGWNTSWSSAAAEAAAGHAADPSVGENRAPAGYTWARRQEEYGDPDHYLTSMNSVRACFNVSGIAALPHKTRFYNYARAYPLNAGQSGTSEWYLDADVENIRQNLWTEWGAPLETVSSTAVSEPLGSIEAALEWCAQPSDPLPLGQSSTYAARGFSVDLAVALVEWSNLYTGRLRKPRIEDPAEDGLVQAGCGCVVDCRPAAEPGWRGMCANPEVRFPLGISSGVGSGGLRVQAYVTEFYAGGETRQFLNIDTWARELSDPGGNWGFARVKRPSGAEVLFSLKGAQAGAALDVDNPYRMYKDGGFLELHFGGDDRIVHRFGGDGTCGIPGVKEVDQLRMTVNNREVTAARAVRKISTDTRVSWSDLVIVRVRDNETFLKRAASPVFPRVLPQYDGKLIASVDYRRADGTSLGATTISEGSRIFTATGAGGVTTRVVRVAASAGGASVAWSDAAGSVGRREVRSETFDPATGVGRLTVSVTVDPGSTGSHSNLTARVFETFAWGEEVTAEIVGADGEDPPTTTYAYHTDPADSNNYGRLARVVEADGMWRRFEYDAAGRPAVVSEAFGDAAPTSAVDACRAVFYTYAGDPALEALNFPAGDVTAPNDRLPRLAVETVLGHEISRTYHAYLDDGTITKRCRAPGAAFDAVSNLTTVVRDVASGDFAGRPASIAHADGTFSLFSYVYDSVAKTLTTIRQTGEGSETAVTNGTETVTVIDAANRVLSLTGRDISSGLKISQIEYFRDDFGRATQVVDRLRGTLTENEYGCCGLERSIDVDGIETLQEHTVMRRLYSSERLGTATFFKYDSFGNVIETRRTAPGLEDVVASARHDGAGRLIAVSDELGGVAQWGYGRTSAGGLVVTNVNPDGSTVVETFHRDGSPRSVSGTGAPPAFYAYGALDGGTYSVEYRGADASAPEWVRTEYDMLGNPVRIVYPDGHEETMEYDAHGRLVREDDGFVRRLTQYGPRGEVFRQAVDMNGNGTIDPASEDRIVETATRYLDVGGKSMREVATAVYRADGSDEPTVISVQRSSLDGGESRTVQFGRTNRVEIVRDRASRTRTETVTRPDGTRSVAAFTNGLLISVAELDAAGGVVSAESFAYDSFMRLSTRTRTAPDGTPQVTRFGRNAAGGVTNETVSAGALERVTRYEHDKMGRVTRTILPGGGEVAVEYGPLGQALRRSGALTYPVSYEYDEAGRPTAMSTYRNGIGAEADTTTWSYDPQRGRIVTKTYADGAGVSYGYYANGALKTRTWARGVSTEYAYNAAGELTGVDYSDDTADVHYTRDRAGRITAVRDAAGERSVIYRPAGSVASQDLPQMPGWTLAYGHDGAGRVTNAALRNASGAALHVTGYTFDSAGRVGGVHGGGTDVTYAYGADGRSVTNVDYGTGLSVGKRYDGLGRLVEHTAWIDGGAMHSDSYAYNDAGLRARRTEAGGSYWVYGYDNLGQLASAKKYFGDGAPVGGAQFEYEYDSIGNRGSVRNFVGRRTRTSEYTANRLNQYLGRTVPGEIFVSGTAHADARVAVQTGGGALPRLANRHGEYFWRDLAVDNAAGVFAATDITVRACMTIVDGSVTSDVVRVERRTAVLPANPESFAFDADGNMLSDGLWSYTWDAENRLAAVESLPEVPEDHKVRCEFVCDDLGRRAGKTVYRRAGGEWIEERDVSYAWDGWNVVAEICRTHTPPHSHTNYYTWGLDISGSPAAAGGIGGLICGIRSTSGSPRTFVYLPDANGNIAALLDTNNVVAAAYEYSPFGEIIRADGPEARNNRFRFCTKHTDAETGLVYYGLRYYDPVRGRWLNRDPIEEIGGENLYAFVDNDPVNAVDPIGLALYAFDGTWNDRTKMKRPTNVAKLHDVYLNRRVYQKGVGTDWYSKILGGVTGAGGKNRLRNMYEQLVKIYNTPDPTGENQQIDIIGFSRGAALARAFVHYINAQGGVDLTGRDGKETGVVCPVEIRFLGLFDTVGSFGIPGNSVNSGYDLSIPENVRYVRHAVAADEKRGMFPLSSVLPGPNAPSTRRIVEKSFPGAHSDVGGGYEDGDRSDLALVWMRDEGVSVGVPFGPLKPRDRVASNPVMHDERGRWEKSRNKPRKVYYCNER